MGVNRYLGGVISADPNTPTVESASGTWTLDEAYQNIGNWPMAQSQIQNSLRFNSADSAYLSRTFGSGGNRKTWTLSFWCKLGTLGTNRNILYAYDGVAGQAAEIRINSSDQISFRRGSAPDILPAEGYIYTNAVFRDPSAWYHIVVVADFTNATAANRGQIYVNGVRQSVTTGDTFATTDGQINGPWAHLLGGTTGYLSGYLTEVNFIDGLALGPEYFGFTDGNGIWQPRPYKGAYGTNGFYLNFSDNSGTTSTTLGKDYSGNGNNWTPNNFSVTAGAGNDSLVDTPTPYGTDTGAGGEVRGNYATMNPLKQVGTLANGNLDITTTATSGITMYGFSTIGVNSGKWYFETTAGTVSTATYVGLYSDPNLATTNYAEYALNNGLWFTTVGGSGSFSASASQGDILGVAVDIDNGTFQLFKNGTSLGTITGITLNTNTWFMGVVSTHAVSTPYSLNFGQRPFAYTAPSGFKALCTQNLPEPTIADGADYFNATLWTGNGATQTITTGLANDLVWTKDRGAAYDHTWFDVLRTPGYFLRSNSTSAEEYRSDSLTAFTSTGFSVGADSVRQNINKSGNAYVSWVWKANGAGVTNTAGSITSTVSANPTAGFSIVTYTGTGSGTPTVGHGLGVAPSMIMVKSRSNVINWGVGHVSAGWSNAGLLNATNSFGGSSYFASTAPTSTVFSIQDTSVTNIGSATYVAYCFSAVSGYSAFGSYVGSGSQPGTFTYLGFNPAFLLVKEADGIDGWGMYDDARNTYNPESYLLQAQDSGAESSAAANYIDFLSNGFRVCTGGSQGNFLNESGKTYIYAAFASNPFKLSRAR